MWDSYIFGYKMVNILIIEHGPVGSSKDIIDGIHEFYPDWHVEAHDPEPAKQLLDKEQWHAVIVDPNCSMPKAVQATREINKALDYDGILPILFVTEDDECLQSSRDAVYTPWIFVGRDKYMIMEMLHAAFLPEFRGSVR